MGQTSVLNPSGSPVMGLVESKVQETLCERCEHRQSRVNLVCLFSNSHDGRAGVKDDKLINFNQTANKWTRSAGL